MWRSAGGYGKSQRLFDDYSAYMEIDQLKVENGYPSDLANHQCIHLFYCSTCHSEELKAKYRNKKRPWGLFIRVQHGCAVQILHQRNALCSYLMLSLETEAV